MSTQNGRKGMVYLSRMLLNLAALITAIFGSFILIRYVVIKLEIDNEMSNAMSVVIVLILAGIIYKIIFPWLQESIVRIFTEKEVEK